MQTFETLIRNQLIKLLERKWPTGNILATFDGDEYIRVVFSKRDVKNEPKCLTISNVSIDEDSQGQGIWKNHIWPTALKAAKDYGYDEVLAQLVYNEKLRKWFKLDRWEKFYGSPEETIPSYRFRINPYYRIHFDAGEVGQRVHMWAQLLKRGKLLGQEVYHFRVLDKDGGFENEHLAIVGINKVKMEPARMNLTYGWFEKVKEEK